MVCVVTVLTVRLDTGGGDAEVTNELKNNVIVLLSANSDNRCLIGMVSEAVALVYYLWNSVYNVPLI